MDDRSIAIEEKTTVVEVKIIERKDQLGNPGPALTFIFTMITACFWGMYQGIFTGPTTIAIGLVQCACYLPYLVGTAIFFMKGNSVFGITFLIFSTLFGGVGGFLNVFSGFAQMNGWDTTYQMSALPFILGGVSVFPVIVVLRAAASKVSFICFFCAMVFLILGGLVTLNILPAGVDILNKWLALIVFLTGTYEFVGGILEAGGSKPLPNGKPFFKS